MTSSAAVNNGAGNAPDPRSRIQDQEIAAFGSSYTD
jgi:hypothetical protein